jgi:tyrosyl-DNA phosphodiesterase 2
LQEAFRIILDDEWVQQYFIVAPRKTEEWPPGAHYGNVTLTSRTVPVSDVYSLEYESHMNRNALFVDLKLSVPAVGASGFVTLRVGNTHLESLPTPGAAMRPTQLALVADVLEEGGLIGGIVCGDMNAISPSDIGLTERLGLMDACREGEDEEDSYTWGYQPPCEFAPGRLDKILFTPGAGGYTVDQPERVGLSVKTEKGQWVSDHYGLVTTVRILA